MSCPNCNPRLAVPLRVRPGNRNPQNVYALTEDGDEVLVAVATSPAAAAVLITAINGHANPLASSNAVSKLPEGAVPAAEEALARVRALHRPTGVSNSTCGTCVSDPYALPADWPCPTIQALEAP